jgi:6-phosphogluconolactonase
VRIEVLADEPAAAQAAAAFIAQEARAAVAARGRFVVALSGGRTPVLMFMALAREHVPWHSVHVVQVDERIAPAGDPDRNLTQLHESLLSHSPLPAAHVHPMPVDDEDLPAAAERYSAELRSIAGSPPVLDLVHLGLGTDGHTASLVPGETALDVLDVLDVEVALTAPYQGRRRMTLTYPVFDHARRVLWVVTGADKAAMLARLCEGDHSIPAGRVRQDRALLIADRAAAGDTGSGRSR